MNEEKLKEELEKWEHEIALDPENFTAHFKRGNTLYKLGREEEALASYNKSLKINPNNEQAHNNQGNVLSALGRNEEALLHYKKSLKGYNRILKINPADDASFANKGIVLSNLGKQKEALKCYIQALKINKDNKIAKQKRRSLIGSQQFWESLSENSRIDLWSGDDDFNTLASREKLKDCSSKDLSCIHRLWV